MASPFLTVLTRCYARPRMLGVNQASLREQTCGDYEQVLLVDEVGRGVGWSYENLAAQGPMLRGAYVWILDDDDRCIRRTLIEELRGIVAEYDPDVVMVRMDHHERGVLPDGGHWGQTPVHGFVGCSAFIVRREVWQTHAQSFLPGSYHSDFDFIGAIFATGQYRIYWHDVVASEVQRISLGRPE